MMYWAAKKKATSIFGHIIKLWTYFSKPNGMPSYSHTEIVFTDGRWFSARELKGGVRFMDGIPVGDTKDMYDFFPIPMSAHDERDCIAWCEAVLKKEDEGEYPDYDVLAILSRFLPIPLSFQSPRRWFCSEVCSAMLQTRGWFIGYDAASLDPNKATSIFIAESAKRGKKLQ